MTKVPWFAGLPVGHTVARVALGCLVVSLVTVAVVLTIQRDGAVIALGREIWADVRRWALP